MFKKVLVAEDMDDINKGVYTMLQEIGVGEIDQVQYCDDAYLKIQRAIIDKNPYDLLITDLSFKKDHRPQEYTSGKELVQALEEKEIAISVIVYSVEDSLQKVRTLLQNSKVKGYICKGRNGLKDLNKAIHKVLQNDTPFLSYQVEKAMKRPSSNEIKQYDIRLMEKLSEGLSQPEISRYFTNNGITPGSLSSVEKRIIKLKDILRANNTAHLVAKAKDSGFI
ncbi:DNA-binding response regulator, NarL/FixJ family, contains REC and HTH domains [Tenacibaculum sp. 190130A14a]|uniref:DNA-binding response regulator, NarL/FixJ family, contains REC and HTH domains n=1 Tax=Tenacibaculum polynesiense TaxID=3137857 RepID=A0ABP1F396_9FLAO